MRQFTLYLPAKRAKSKKAQTKVFPAHVVELLKTIPRFEKCPFVFPSVRTKKALKDIRRPWEAMRAAVGLDAAYGKEKDEDVDAEVVQINSKR